MSCRSGTAKYDGRKFRHLIYKSVSTQTIEDSIKNVCGNYELILKNLIEEAGDYDANPAKFCITIYKKTIGSTIKSDFPAIELLMLIASGYDNFLEVMMQQIRNANISKSHRMFSDRILPIEGHLLLSPYEDIRRRLNLTLLMGFNIPDLYNSLVVCYMYVIHAKQDIMLIAKFNYIMSLIFGMGWHPDDVCPVVHNPNYKEFLYGSYESYINRTALFNRLYTHLFHRLIKKSMR
jgi:hypothetical protein